jgi:hypothetical protein
MIKLLCVILAIVCFLLDAFRVSTPKISWTPLGFAFVTAAVWLTI